MISLKINVSVKEVLSIIGRFVSEDIYHGDGLNLYAYCRNNLVIYYDPSGYACESKGNTLIC